MKKAYDSLPRDVQFEVAQFLGRPSFIMFVETAIAELQQAQRSMTRPMVADPNRCQQYVAECMSLNDQEWQLRALLELAKTDFDTTSLETY